MALSDDTVLTKRIGAPQYGIGDRGIGLPAGGGRTKTRRVWRLVGMACKPFEYKVAHLRAFLQEDGVDVLGRWLFGSLHKRVMQKLARGYGD